MPRSAASASFAVEIGSIEPASTEKYLTLVETGLASLAASQSEVVREAETGELVLELIRTGFLTGRYYLASFDGTESPPDHATQVGWREVVKEKRAVGWRGRDRR
jgi:hypothetical protein